MPTQKTAYLGALVARFTHLVFVSTEDKTSDELIATLDGEGFDVAFSCSADRDFNLRLNRLAHLSAVFPITQIQSGNEEKTKPLEPRQSAVTAGNNLLGLMLSFIGNRKSFRALIVIPDTELLRGFLLAIRNELQQIGAPPSQVVSDLLVATNLGTNEMVCLDIKAERGKEIAFDSRRIELKIPTT